MNVYLKALRAPFLSGSLIPVIIGSALAFSKECFSMSFFLITALGVAALHLGANLLNDYYDAGGSDSINLRLTPFSGGSRVIQDREIAPWAILLISLFFFGLGLVIGIWLVYLGRPFVIAIGFFGFAAGWAYSAPPLQLMSRSWGEVLIFFVFGPAITLGTYYVMSGSLSWQAFALGLPQGFFITGVILINQFPDYQADRDSGKKNLIVRWGPDKCRYLYCIIMLLAFVAGISLISIAGLSYLILFSLIALPLGVKAMIILWKECQSHKEMIPAQSLTIQTLIAHGMLFSTGIFLSRFM